ncbi:MAG: hypothetical protein WC465_03800 [Patescibacteria group bacterium]
MTKKRGLAWVLIATVLLCCLLLLIPLVQRGIRVLQEQDQQSREQCMISYAEMIDNYLQRTHQNGQDHTFGLLVLNQQLEGYASPYSTDLGPMRVVSCNEFGEPLQPVDRRCHLIGYYTSVDGKVYKLFVWDTAGRLIWVRRN